MFRAAFLPILARACIINWQFTPVSKYMLFLLLASIYLSIFFLHNNGITNQYQHRLFCFATHPVTTSPCACAICQCPMLTIRFLAVTRGKVAKSPPQNTPGTLVRMYCRKIQWDWEPIIDADSWNLMLELLKMTIITICSLASYFFIIIIFFNF